MLEDIGHTAGAVWAALKKSEQASIAELRKTTGLSADQLNRAIGWLAREDKLEAEQKGKTVKIRLKG